MGPRTPRPLRLGGEEAGLALATASELATYNAAMPARSLIKSSGYRTLLRDVVARPQPSAMLGS